MNRWLDPEPQGKKRIIVSTGAGTLAQLKQDALSVSNLRAVAIKFPAVGQVSLDDAFAACKDVLTVVSVDNETEVEAVVRAASAAEHAGRTMILSSHDDVLGKLRRIPGARGMVTGRLLGEAEAQTKAKLKTLLMKAGDPTFLFPRWSQLSGGKLRDCRRPMIVGAADEVPLADALGHGQVHGIVTRYLGQAVMARQLKQPTNGFRPLRNKGREDQP